MKVTINLPENALRMADEAAEKMCLSRSAFISLAIAQKCQQDSFMDSFPKMIAELQAFRDAVQKQQQDESGALLT